MFCRRADKSEISATPIHTFDELISILCELWPEDLLPPTVDDPLRQWESDARLRSMVYGEVQQWLYLFLPFDQLPRIDDRMKTRIKAAYESLLNSDDCSHTQRIEKLLALINYNRPATEDKYYKAAIEFHSKRIQTERALRWSCR